MIIAHRGASGSAPENTIPAIKKAIEFGANFIEVDIHQTRDQKLVAIHDFTVDRTTNGTGEIARLNYKDLQFLDAGSWFDQKFAGTQIPMLSEIFPLIPDSVKLIIEVKGDSADYPDIENNVVNLVREHNFEERVILKSFDEDVLDHFKMLAPEIPRLLVYVFGFGVLDTEVTYLQHYELFLSKGFTESAQKEGYKVIAWGVQSESEMEKVLSYGVDGIETDFPENLIKLIKINKK